MAEDTGAQLAALFWLKVGDAARLLHRDPLPAYLRSYRLLRRIVAKRTA